MTRLLTVLSIGGALFWALPASSQNTSSGTGQITADDVLANSAALYAAFGATRSVATDRNGSVVTVSTEIIDVQFPMGSGDMTAALSDYSLEENADGTVSIVYPAGFSVLLTGRIQGQGDASVILETGPGPITTIASGSPGAISYDTRTDALVVTLRDALASGVPDLSVNMTFALDSSEIRTRVLEDSLMVVFSESRFGAADMQFEATGASVSSITDAQYGPTVTTFNMGLIPGGTELLDLTTALRDGMYVSITSTSTRSETLTETFLSGVLYDRQSASSGTSEGSFLLDRYGLEIGFEGSDIAINMEQPSIGIDTIGFDLGRVSGLFRVPLLAASAAQDFAYVLTLGDLRLGPTIWALFDPDKALDRSPATLGIDFAGSVINSVDWTDILALEGLQTGPVLPFEITSLTIRDISLAALGARLTGQGAFTFDAGDTVTYPGVPRPTGEAALEASGVNDALDALDRIDALPPEALFGLRLGLGMVTEPGPAPGTLTSRIEMTADGQIIANGQRLR